MKKLLLSAILLLGALPAQALPGYNFNQTESWVKKHTFLSPWLDGYKGSSNAYPHILTAFRELQDNWFFDIDMYFDGESASLLKRRIDQARLFLLKKEYNPDKETHPGGRKWDNIACKDIWERNNATAYQLMEKAYSKEIAEDFKNARLIFDGTYAIVTRIGWGHLDVDPISANFDDAKTWKMINEYPAKVFLGKKYAYRRAYQPNYLYNEEADVPHNIPEKSCTFLSIQSIDRGKQDAKILSANQKVYERWSALESNKNNRLKPANISVE